MFIKTKFVKKSKSRVHTQTNTFLFDWKLKTDYVDEYQMYAERGTLLKVEQKKRLMLMLKAWTFYHLLKLYHKWTLNFMKLKLENSTGKKIVAEKRFSLELHFKYPVEIK